MKNIVCLRKGFGNFLTVDWEHVHVLFTIGDGIDIRSEILANGCPVCTKLRLISIWASVQSDHCVCFPIDCTVIGPVKQIF